MARRTLSRMAGLTPDAVRNTLETAVVETLARAATSTIVTRLGAPGRTIALLGSPGCTQRLPHPRAVSARPARVFHVCGVTAYRLGFYRPLTHRLPRRPLDAAVGV